MAGKTIVDFVDVRTIWTLGDLGLHDAGSVVVEDLAGVSVKVDILVR